MSWRTESPIPFRAIGHRSPPFAIYESRETGACILTSGAPYWCGPIHTASLDEAKAHAERIARDTGGTS